MPASAAQQSTLVLMHTGTVLLSAQVDDAMPLSAATLERLLAAARGGGSGGGLEAALQQLDARELRQFERFVASGQVP
jgi:hypothetical protein